MANPNEIDFKINMPPGPVEEFRKLLDQFRALSAGIKGSLSAVGDEVKDVAEAVRIMGERAKATGSAEVMKSVRASFTEGFGTASSLDARAGKISAGVGVIDKRVAAAEAAVLGGELSPEKGVALMRKYIADAQKAGKKTDELAYSTEVTKGDLFTAAPLDDALASYNRVASEIRDTKDAAAALKRELIAQANAFAEQREELDANSATYEQEAAELMKREKAYRSLSAAAEKAENDAASSIAKTQEAFTAYDGSAESLAKIAKATTDAEAAQKKLDTQVQKVANDRAMAEQKEAASAEKARNKAEEDAQKAAEREEAARMRAEEKARREEEAAARREQREEEMARRDAERAEKEAYATSLVTMSKQQLYAELQRVNEERQKAAELNDLEALRKLNMQYAVGRSQMEKTNNSMRIQRMLYLQQAQAAKRMGESLNEIVDGISSVGEQAEEGELDLTGMAGSAMELYNQFKEGIGPSMAFTMALKAVQDVMNHTAKLEKEMAEANDEYRAAYETRIDIINDYKEAIQAAEEAAAHEDALERLQDVYKKLNAEVDSYVKNLDKASTAADRAAARAEAEVEHRRQLRIMALSQMLTAGTITQEQYDIEMINIDHETAIKAAQSRSDAAKRKASSTRDKSKFLTKKAEEATRREESTRAYSESFASDEEISVYEKKRKELQDKIDEAFAKRNEILHAPLEADAIAGLSQMAGDLYDALYPDGVERKWQTPEEAKRFILDSYGKIMDEGTEAIRLLDAEFGKRTGLGINGAGDEGKMSEYKKRRDAAMRDAELANQAAEEARRKADEAAAAAEAAAEAAKNEAENADDVTRRAGEMAEAKRSGLQVNAAAKAEAKRHADEIEKLRKDVAKATQKGLKKQLEEADKLASDQTPEGRYYMQRQAIIKAEIERRNAVRAEAKAARANSAEFAEGSASRKNMDWLLGSASKAVKDGTVTEDTFRKLLEALTASQRTKSTADDELVKALILQIKKIKDGDAKSLKKLKNVQYELSR